MLLRLAGEAGQASLARSGEEAGLRAIVDQHAAEIRNALTRRGRKLTQAALLGYAQGFTETAIGQGWWPPHRRGYLDPDYGQWLEPESAPLSREPFLDQEPPLDWESFRLAAICQLLID